MVGNTSIARKVFVFINTALLIIFSLLCLLPIIHVLAISLSSSTAASAGEVSFWPVEFNLISYSFVLKKTEFWRSLIVTFKRVILGVTVNMILTIITAYPLSKDKKDFRARMVYVWIFVFTMLFSGGLIPTYMVVRSLGLLDKIWALILPGALPVFNVVLLLNFFRSLPREIEESALIDGASHWKILWLIYVPISLPAIATLIVFSIVGHWNSWFDGMIYMNNASKYPLQTYLQTLVVQPSSQIMTKATAEMLRHISERTVKSAQIFIGAIPVLMVYPFLQKYFMTGIVLGSVKE